MTSTLEVDVIERRLLLWAAWRNGGRTAAGYPTRNVLHPGWTPPTRGAVPSMRVVPQQRDTIERLTDEAVKALPRRLQDTVTAVYIMRSPVAERAKLLDCAESTVRARVGEAKRLMGAWFASLAEQGATTQI